MTETISPKHEWYGACPRCSNLAKMTDANIANPGKLRRIETPHGLEDVPDGVVVSECFNRDCRAKSIFTGVSQPTMTRGVRSRFIR